MIFAIKGQVAWSKSPNQLYTSPDSFLVVNGRKCMGVFRELPEEYQDIPVRDCGTSLVIPGMIDLHTHAPQYAIRGIGMDLELLPWLTTYTFPEEAKFENLSYAYKEYSLFADELRRSWTTRACVYATIHNRATDVLMSLLEETGLVTYVGRVNMDRNGGDHLVEKNSEQALSDTLAWLNLVEEHQFRHTKPILTPRFIPSCTDELMIGLTKIAQEHGIRIQSHLSENPEEIRWVQELVPESTGYADAYERFGSLRDAEHPSIMAHCVYLKDEEAEILKAHGTYIAHCPGSNMNLSSGIAPAAKYLRNGLSIGLGSDIGAGETLSMTRQVVLALRASKLYTRMVDPSLAPLSFEEAFWLATAGGGSYFGKVGRFEPGFDADILVIDDTAAAYDNDEERPIIKRLERAIFLAGETRMISKYVAGRRIL